MKKGKVNRDGSKYKEHVCWGSGWREQCLRREVGREEGGRQGEEMRWQRKGRVERKEVVYEVNSDMG